MTKNHETGKLEQREFSRFARASEKIVGLMSRPSYWDRKRAEFDAGAWARKNRFNNRRQELYDSGMQEELAFERASLEEYCEDRNRLPGNMTPRIRRELRKAGFHMEKHPAATHRLNLLFADFPEGWSLKPAHEDPFQEGPYPMQALLRDADDEPRYLIKFLDKSFELRPSVSIDTYTGPEQIYSPRNQYRTIE